jgi:hypothetical protein
MRCAWVQILRERNLTLFHRFLAEHIEAVLPIFYTLRPGLDRCLRGRERRPPGHAHHCGSARSGACPARRAL